MKLLYISYNGALSPLVASQALPYLHGLASGGERFVLLTFDPPDQRGSGPGWDRLASGLAASGIEWRSLRYHKRPRLAATLFDVAAGSLTALRLAASRRVQVVHARSYVPALIGLICKRLLGTRLIFDMRGMMADEYVDAGTWTRTSAGYRLTKAAERVLLSQADAVVVLTDRIRRHLVQRQPALAEPGRTSVIPCCVDLDAFGAAAASRRQPAKGLEGRIVLVYTGSLGAWQLLDEMLDFLACGLEGDGGAHLVIVNRSEQDLVRARLEARPELRCAVTLASADPGDIPAYLARADAGISFRRPTFSQWAASPIKVAEYLAAGLPVVTNAGIGDLDEQLFAYRAGVVVPELTAAAYCEAWAALRRLLGDRDAARRARALAQDVYDLRKGVAAYRDVYAYLGTLSGRQPERTRRPGSVARPVDGGRRPRARRRRGS